MCVGLANNTLRATGVVAQDELDAHGALRTLYTSPAFAAFTARIAEHEQLYTMDDELAGCTGEILREGQVRAWQFAPTSVLALAMLQRPETGGAALIFRNVTALIEQEGGEEDRSVMGVVGVESVASEKMEALRTILQVTILNSQLTTIFAGSRQPGTTCRSICVTHKSDCRNTFCRFPADCNGLSFSPHSVFCASHSNWIVVSGLS